MDTDVKNGGFTIVEIMVSLLLVSVALMAIAATFPRMTRHKQAIREVEEAYVIAADVLEELYVSDNFTAGDNGNLPTVTRNFTDFNIEYTVTNPDGFLIATVTVAWNKMGHNHSVSLAGVVR